MNPLRANGPFIYEEYNPNVIAQVYIQGSFLTAEAVGRLAQLFAAAPDMFEALERLLTFHEPQSQEDQLRDPTIRAEAKQAWDNARAVVAKARRGVRQGGAV